MQLNWNPLDDDARDGREVLLRCDTGGGHCVYAAYYGLAQRSTAAGADEKHPWVILDTTNGINQLRDDKALVGYVSINDLK